MKVNEFLKGNTANFASPHIPRINLNETLRKSKKDLKEDSPGRNSVDLEHFTGETRKKEKLEII
jgi:hypothetical protein